MLLIQVPLYYCSAFATLITIAIKKPKLVAVVNQENLNGYFLYILNGQLKVII